MKTPRESKEAPATLRTSKAVLRASFVGEISDVTNSHIQEVMVQALEHFLDRKKNPQIQNPLSATTRPLFCHFLEQAGDTSFPASASKQIPGILQMHKMMMQMVSSGMLQKIADARAAGQNIDLVQEQKVRDDGNKILSFEYRISDKPAAKDSQN